MTSRLLIRSSKLLAIVATAALQLAAADGKPQSPVLKAFHNRAVAYVALQQKLNSGLPPLQPTDEPARITTHRRALAEKVRAARLNAQPGDIFGKASGPIKEAMAKDAQTRSVRDAYAAMQEVPPQAPPAINADYPEKEPLATVPPLILKRLPELPDGLEYRFMGRSLILYDSKSNLILDFIQDAVPIVRR